MQKYAGRGAGNMQIFVEEFSLYGTGDGKGLEPISLLSTIPSLLFRISPLHLFLFYFVQQTAYSVADINNLTIS